MSEKPTTTTEQEASANAAGAAPPVPEPAAPEDGAAEAEPTPLEEEEASPGEELPEEAPVAEQDEAAKYRALAQRTQADFDNYRKRMARENAAAVDRGVGKLAKELLPALDHLDLALNAAQEHEDVVKGFAMVREELVGALAKVGIQPFSPQGEAFDPNEHEAMAQQPIEGAEPGTVAQVYQQGYRINGAVLRPARVIVAA